MVDVIQVSKMRTFYMLAAICVVGVYCKPGDDLPAPHVECAKKCNYELTDDKVPKPTDEAYCWTHCVFDYEKEKAGFKSSYYEQFMAHVKDAFERKKIKSDTYTRANLESILIACKDKENNHIEFLKCIKFLEPPFWSFYKTYFHNI